MEILRFDDEPTATPKRKRSSRGLLAVAFFAMVLGVGSAFASSTISINGTSNQIDLGQGVSTVTACDTAIDITAATEISNLETSPFFYLKSLVLKKIDTTTSGCAGKTLNIKIYHSATAYTCAELGFTGDSQTSGVLSDSGSLSSFSCDSATILASIPNTTEILPGASEANLTITFKKTGDTSNISAVTVVSSN